MKDDEMAGACSTREGEEKWIRLVRKLGEKRPVEDLGLYGRIILKCI
jgi:hypothetical protein